jgi:hypothetical protein
MGTAEARYFHGEYLQLSRRSRFHGYAVRIEDDGREFNIEFFSGSEIKRIIEAQNGEFLATKQESQQR